MAGWTESSKSRRATSHYLRSWTVEMLYSYVTLLTFFHLGKELVDGLEDQVEALVSDLLWKRRDEPCPDSTKVKTYGTLDCGFEMMREAWTDLTHAFAAGDLLSCAIQASYRISGVNHVFKIAMEFLELVLV